MSPSRRQDEPTKDGVVASRPLTVDVVLACHKPGCGLSDEAGDPKARVRLGSRARRHAAATGHLVGVMSTTIVDYHAER